MKYLRRGNAFMLVMVLLLIMLAVPGSRAVVKSKLKGLPLVVEHFTFKSK